MLGALYNSATSDNKVTNSFFLLEYYWKDLLNIFLLCFSIFILVDCSYTDYSAL